MNAQKDLIQTPEILYEDNHIVVAIKKPGVLSQSTGRQTPDMLTLLKDDIRIRYRKPGNVFLGLVHRLDQPVGGLMVFARTSKAAARLSEQIRAHQLKRYYLAVVDGHLPEAAATWQDYLEKMPTGYVTISTPQSGKKASLSYRAIQFCRKPEHTLVCVQLGTGRPHQIRVQFSERKHPIVGDRRYGNPDLGLSDWTTNEPALFACGLHFMHPTRKEPLSFIALPPDTLPWRHFDLPDDDHLSDLFSAF